MPAAPFGLRVEHHLVDRAPGPVLIRTETYVAPVRHFVYHVAAKYHRRIGRRFDQFFPQGFPAGYVRYFVTFFFDPPAF